ncbi:uncharacterized protein DSM5745_09204 [Aspergillus mulundensis]|uniref:Major facilitator superfamily (MFS) profile domain-containing protein n=1 Tax=Aspergillus mulundensis TaxID=1810919 RepID=A0A3D8R068_9EURO|nr:Uncharacterized protein DSM5745_09204 [Aspergillus mulundensis]RDW67338.1 Uncharacterized protein DSM5745_09204 [Aspergillus mulundensis]
MPSSDSGVNSTMWPPGTVLLEEKTASGNSFILQPRPTNDPNDPLNWPTWRKYLNLGLVCFWVALVAEFINAPTPTWSPMQEELGYTDEVLNDSYAAGCAALGVGSLVLIPFVLKFGRRPLYLICTVIQLAVSVWSAKMQTVTDLMLVNVIQCFFASLAETVVQMTIADVFFVHQRGRMNTIYVWVWLFATYLGPLIAGFVAKGQGWRWVWWWNVVVFGVAVLVVAFGYEETKYSPRAEALESVPVPDISEASKVSDTLANGKVVDKTKDDNDIEIASVPALEATPLAINPTIPKKTYWQRLALTTPTSSDTESSFSFLQYTYQPLFLLATIPAITFAALVYGILVGLGDVMSTTMSTFLPSSPYNFTSDQVGLMHLPRMIGVTIGALITGPLSDWWIIYISRRRNGVYEPECRLWCVIPFLPFIPVGALLFGIGLDRGLPWIIIAVGLALYNIGVTPINSLVVTYLTDSYREIIGPALVAVTLIRNAFSTAFIFALTPWEDAIGLKYVLVTILLIACVILSGFGVFIRWGKVFRERSADRYRASAGRQYRERAGDNA